MDIQGLCRTSLTLHWLQCSGEMTPFLTGSTQDSAFCALARQSCGTGPGGRGLGELALWESRLDHLFPWGGDTCTHLGQLEKLPSKAMSLQELALPLTSSCTWESRPVPCYWSWPDGRGTNEPGPGSLQHLGEWAPCLGLAAQWSWLWQHGFY